MEWKTTKPPHVGWWLCRGDWWRWWDGSVWSFGAKPGCAESTLQAAYRTPAVNQVIEWCDFWPEDALVPRLSTNPELKKKQQNKRKTMYVVMDCSRIDNPAAVFTQKENAQEYADRISWPRIKKIRFRTPE